MTTTPEPEAATPSRRRRGIGILLILLILGTIYQVSSYCHDRIPRNPRLRVAEVHRVWRNPRWRVTLSVEPRVADLLQDGRLRPEVRIRAYSQGLPAGFQRFQCPRDWETTDQWAEVSRVEMVARTEMATVFLHVPDHVTWNESDLLRAVAYHVMVILRNPEGEKVGRVYEKMFPERRAAAEALEAQANR